MYASEDAGPLAGLEPAETHQVFMINTGNTGSSRGSAGSVPASEPVQQQATQDAPQPPPALAAPYWTQQNWQWPMPSEWQGTAPPMMMMAPMQPQVADLPAWATMNEFGFARPEGQGPQTLTEEADPLFPGAYEQHAPSTLEWNNQPQIDQQWATETTLENWYDEPVLPNIETISRLDTAHHSFIDQFWQVQHHNTAIRDYTKGKAKGKGKPHEVPIQNTSAATPDEPVTFDGDDRICAICLEEFEGGDRCLRVVCRHVFHVHCWNDLLISTEETTESCPSCRGSARIVARFRFIAAPVDAYVPPTGAAAQPIVHVLSPQVSRQNSQDSFQSILPWTPSPGQQPDGYYHASTQLPGGIPSIMVDVGAWTNLAGKVIARKIAQVAIGSGLKPEQKKMNIPFQIMGVGNGSQACTWETKLPICIDDGEGGSTVHYFETPTVDGTGGDIPALLGLRSISGKQGVLETAAGKEKLSFPGPGGYSITWSPGTQHLPLQRAPSGHLVVPLGDFSKIKKPTGGLAPQSTIFHARLPHVNASSSSSAGPMSHQ